MQEAVIRMTKMMLATSLSPSSSSPFSEAEAEENSELTTTTSKNNLFNKKNNKPVLLFIFTLLLPLFTHKKGNGYHNHSNLIHVEAFQFAPASSKTTTTTTTTLSSGFLFKDTNNNSSRSSPRRVGKVPSVLFLTTNTLTGRTSSSSSSSSPSSRRHFPLVQRQSHHRHPKIHTVITASSTSSATGSVDKDDDTSIDPIPSSISIDNNWDGLDERVVVNNGKNYDDDYIDGPTNNSVGSLSNQSSSSSSFLTNLFTKRIRQLQKQRRQGRGGRRRPATTTRASPTRITSAAPFFLVHERDFFRQLARLNSMDSYVLVSTLTASMSFGCLAGFTPDRSILHRTLYRILCWSIQTVSGLSALCGLYATIIFSLTLLYSKSALGAERDMEYDQFLRCTVRARVRGARCFSLSLALFALEAVLVLMERTYMLCGRIRYAFPCGILSFILLYRLYQDWQLLARGREQIFKDD